MCVELESFFLFGEPSLVLFIGVPTVAAFGTSAFVVEVDAGTPVCVCVAALWTLSHAEFRF